MKIRSTSLLSALLVLTLAALTFGQAAPAAAPPTKLAVVNIVSLFSDLLEKKAADGEIEKMKGDFEKEGRRRQAELADMEQALGKLAPGKPDFEKAQEDLLKKSMELQAFNSYAQQRLFVELRVRTAALYRKINEAVAKYAAANGIALVFVADASNMEKATSQEMLMGMITTRKILYSHPDYDITSKIKQMMNIEFETGKIGG